MCVNVDMNLFAPLLPLFPQIQVDPVHRVVLGVQGGLALPLVLSHLLVPEQKDRWIMGKVVR